MAAGELLPRRVADEETRDETWGLNAAAYEFPIEAGRQALAAPQIWSDEFAG
jgi:hypothetical protein